MAVGVSPCRALRAARVRLLPLSGRLVVAVLLTASRRGRNPRPPPPGLEDELIRALGADGVQEVVAAEGELRAFRTLQKQAEWRGRATEQQLQRFMGSGGSRKVRYARLLVEALDPARIPRPLRLLLAGL